MKACGAFRSYPLTLIGFADTPSGSLLSVTADPDGRVWVEPPEDAAEVDILATYRTGGALRDLEPLIHSELQFHRDLTRAKL